MKKQFLKKFFYIVLITILVQRETALGKEVFLSITREGTPYRFLPTNTVIITRQEIKSSGVKNLGELIDNYTTADVSHYATLGSLKSVRLRNSTSNQVLILLNGVPLNSIAKGSFNLANLPIEIVDRVEIFQGSASAFYGANAVSGIVNIITETASSISPEIKPALSYGSFDTLCYNVVLDYMKPDNYGINFNFSKKHSDGWRENSDYDSINGYMNFSKFLNKGKFYITFLTHESDLGVPGATSVPKDQWDGEKEKKASSPLARQKDSNLHLILGYETSFLTTKLDVSQENLLYDDPSPLFPTKTDSRLTGLVINNTLSFPYGITLVSEFVYNYLNQMYPLNPTDNFKKDIYNLGVVVQKQFSSERMSFIPLLRCDTNSHFGTGVSPQGIFVYNINGTKFSISLGRSWRSPTFLDLYWPDQVWAKGNPDLKPEESYSVDLGIEYPIGVVTLSINPFYRYIKDQIRWYSPDLLSPWQPSNVDTAVSQGTELKLHFVPVRWLENKITFLFQDSKIYKKGEENLSWQRPAYSPVITANYLLSLNLPYGIGIYTDVKYVDTQYSRDNEKGVKLDPYTLWNLRFRKMLGRMANVYVQVNDLLDQKGVNRAGYPQPGRSYETGINLNFTL